MTSRLRSLTPPGLCRYCDLRRWYPLAENRVSALSSCLGAPVIYEGDDPKPIGELLDGLGVEATLEDGDLPAAAVVLMKVIEPDGTERLSIAWSDGISWLERVGMLAYGNAVEQVVQE